MRRETTASATSVRCPTRKDPGQTRRGICGGQGAEMDLDPDQDLCTPFRIPDRRCSTIIPACASRHNLGTYNIREAPEATNRFKNPPGACFAIWKICLPCGGKAHCSTRYRLKTGTSLPIYGDESAGIWLRYSSNSHVLQALPKLLLHDARLQESVPASLMAGLSFRDSLWLWLWRLADFATE